MCMCMHMHMSKCAYVYISQLCTHPCLWICMHLWTLLHACKNACIQACMYLCMCILNLDQKEHKNGNIGRKTAGNREHWPQNRREQGTLAEKQPGTGNIGPPLYDPQYFWNNDLFRLINCHHELKHSTVSDRQDMIMKWRNVWRNYAMANRCQLNINRLFR